jgi:hypothetical protein
MYEIQALPTGNGEAMTDQERTELLRACARLIDDFKRRYDVDGKVGPVQQDAHSVASALQRLLAEQSSVQMICGACGEPWREGLECEQKDNGHPFPVCYAAPLPHPQEQAAPAVYPVSAEAEPGAELERLRAENELVRRSYSGLLAFVKDVSRDPLNAKCRLAQELLDTGVYSEAKHVCEKAGCDASTQPGHAYCDEHNLAPEAVPKTYTNMGQAAPAEVEDVLFRPQMLASVEVSEEAKGHASGLVANIRLLTDDAAASDYLAKMLTLREQAHLSARPGMPTREQIAQVIWQHRESIVEGNSIVAVDALVALLEGKAAS